MKDSEATRFDALSYDKVIAEKLGVMDATAIVMCRDNQLPIRVFKLATPGNLLRVVRGEAVGTLVHG